MKPFLLILLCFLFINPAMAKPMIIVNVAVDVDKISKDQLQDFYFKRSRNWPNGELVRFFDRQDNTNLRTEFLRTFIGRSARQVEQFWIGQKFNTGDSAPTQISSDSMIMNLVSRFPGGIGYVREGTPLKSNVKALNVTDL